MVVVTVVVVVEVVVVAAAVGSSGGSIAVVVAAIVLTGMWSVVPAMGVMVVVTEVVVRRIRSNRTGSI